MSTRLTYRAAVQLQGFDALPSATIDAAVEQARRRVLTDRRWSFTEANAALLTTVGVNSVSLSTLVDVDYIDAVRLTTSTNEPVPIEYRERSFIRDLQDNQGSFTGGCPAYWTRVEDTLVFWPTPQQVYTIDVEGVAPPTALAADDSVDVIPDKHSDLVVWAAVVPLSFRQRDFNASTAADQYFSKVLLPLHAGQDAVEQRQNSQQIRTGWWSY